jgi:thiopurine S-methyltransferase
MEIDRWLNAWKDNNIRFHADEVNPVLLRHYSHLNLKNDDLVFVPLCGKSVDMPWMVEQGQEVLGVELSPIAIESFFKEQNLKFVQSKKDKFTQYKSENIELLLGNYFNLTATDLSKVKAVYDRAALVALPKDVRKKYIQLMEEKLSVGTKLLLVSFEYDQKEMDGPPFCVSEEEIRQNFSGFQSVELLANDGVSLKDKGKSEAIERLKNFGLSWMNQKVYLITK